jgi:hypothetical protein
MQLELNWAKISIRELTNDGNNEQLFNIFLHQFASHLSSIEFEFNSNEYEFYWTWVEFNQIEIQFNLVWI